MSHQNIYYLEFHDARIEKVTVLTSSEVILEFNHICSYHGEDDKFREVWSSTAALQLSGVSHFEIEGEMRADDYIATGSLLDDQDEEVALLPVNAEKQVHRLNLLLAGSGTKISLMLKTATLINLTPQTKLEDWQE